MDESVGNDRKLGGQSTPETGTGAGRAAGRVPETGTGTGTGEEEIMEAMTRFMKTITGRLLNNTLPVDLEESELLEVLEELEYIDLHVFDPASVSVAKARAHIRYLTALWPEATVAEAAERIHALLNNRSISFSDVMTILRGRKLSERSQMADLRSVLRGEKLGNAQERTHEVPVPIIQGIGRCLSDGVSMRETARIMHVSLDTVRSIEKFLGLHSASQKRLMDAALDAVRENVSIRNYAAQSGLSKGSAENWLNKARAVLRELGES